MRRSSSSFSSPRLRYLDAMSSRSYFRGGRRQHGRFFSDHRGRQLVTGDAHFQQAVQDASLGFHQRPPPPYNQSQQFRPRYNNNNNNFDPNPPFRRPPPPVDRNRGQYQNPQFRQPPPFDWRQAFPPPTHARPPKELNYRSWEFSKTPPPPNAERFTVVSYNILADYHATNHRNLYFHVPRRMMDWEWRKGNIVFEIGLWSPDIMCFQEVDRFQDLERELKPRGYNGIWKMRTGNAVDGCAVFWRASRFKLLYEESIEYNKLGLRDNVAQICVLEQLQSQNQTPTSSDLPTSLAGCNKVVICNIHVLYNPKRGEIKLGQVRTLLDRAHAVSKMWNDAPVVVCGDFNCTPKSPLYNFISEQRLDLSGIDRSKVSGQASAEIRSPQLHNSGHTPETNPWTQPFDNMVQVPLKVHEKLGDSLSDMQKQNNPENNGKNILSVSDFCEAQYSGAVLDASDTLQIVEQCQTVEGALHVEETKGSQQDVMDCCKDGNLSDKSVLIDSSKERPNKFHNEGDFAVDQMNSEIQESTPSVISQPEAAYAARTEMELREKVNSTPLSNQQLSCESTQSIAFTEDTRVDVNNIAHSLQVFPPSSPGCLSPQKIVNEKNSVASTRYQADLQSVSTSIGCTGEKELELHHELNEFVPEGGIVHEDQNTFLAALHNTGGSFPRGIASDPNNSQMHFPSDEIVDDFSQLDLPSDEVPDDFSLGLEQTAYDPSLWTPGEIVTATGSADCFFLEHPLKLKSTYTEIEGCSGTRDSNGEPLVTSYHRCFLGTVDYIWRSQGLRTVRVLAPIPKDAMQWTEGFPTKKWGSDHIALASELAFTKDAAD